MPENAVGVILLLLQEGSGGHAVKLYQEETGAHRIQAQQAVRDLARDHGLPTLDGGWRRLGSLLLLVLSGLLGVLFC